MSYISYREQIENVARRLRELRRLKEAVDPASGMSIHIRRGVLSDANEDDNDRPRRDWISLETSHNMEEVIDLLIESQEKSLAFWIKSATDESKKLDEAIKDAKTLV